jgi:creatinine amidohydrolase
MSADYKGKPYILSETNWKKIKESNYTIAILPWGATEPHNYHLPYGTDVIESEFIASSAAEYAWKKGAKVIVLPCIPFGVNTGQINLDFAINMNPSTQFLVLKDIVDSLSRQSIKKLVILNSHGGNDFKPMIRELQLLYPRVFVCLINWYKTTDAAKYFDEPGDHAGEMETSIMMKIAPEIILPLHEAGIGKENKFKIKALREGLVWAQRDWMKAAPDTGVGNPKLSSEQKGESFLSELKKRIGDFLIDLDSADENDLYT